MKPHEFWRSGDILVDRGMTTSAAVLYWCAARSHLFRWLAERDLGYSSTRQALLTAINHPKLATVSSELLYVYLVSTLADYDRSMVLTDSELMEFRVKCEIVIGVLSNKEQRSGSTPMVSDKNYYNIACEEVQRHLEDCEVSKLAHFDAAQRFEERHRYWLGVPATVLSIALTWLLTSPIERMIAGETGLFVKTSLPIWISLFVSILTTLSAFLNFNDLSVRHRSAAHKYHALWRQCKNWQTDFPNELFVKEAVQMARQYRERLNEINNDAPQIPRWAWKSVRKQRLEGSTSYRVDSDQAHTLKP